MSDKPSVSMTPESDGFAARYDRMVERNGGWAMKIFVGILALIVIAAIARALLG